MTRKVHKYTVPASSGVLQPTIVSTARLVGLKNLQRSCGIARIAAANASDQCDACGHHFNQLAALWTYSTKTECSEKDVLSAPLTKTIFTSCGIEPAPLLAPECYQTFLRS